METFYEKQDLELLFGGEAIDPHDLNDDALGRTLDALHQAGLDPFTMRWLSVSWRWAG